MTIRVPHGASVVVVRDGKRFSVPVGSAFEFTDDEIASVQKAAPGALRAPVNEVLATAPAAVEGEEGKKTPTKTSGKGKKSATAKATEKSKTVTTPAPDADDDDDDDDDSDI